MRPMNKNNEQKCGTKQCVVSVRIACEHMELGGELVE
jgi:hypothetical protein